MNPERDGGSRKSLIHPGAISAALTAEDGSPLTVLRFDGRAQVLSELWAEHHTILVFVRHFLCITCQDYYKRIFAAFIMTDYMEQNYQLAVIGCGSVSLGRALAADIGSDTNSRTILLTDPQRSAYAALKLVHAVSCDVPLILRNIMLAAVQGVTRCWCICASGDPAQNGGVFVIRRGGECLYQHIDQTPSDHADIDEIFAAAGLKRIGGVAR